MRYLLLYENFTKNKWEIILSNPQKKIEGQNLINLVSNAYKHTSKGSFVKSVSDVIKSNWFVIDCNEEDGIDACIFFREPRSGENWVGKKIQGIGHDGEKESKKHVISKLVNTLKEEGTWIEVSEKLEEVLVSNGCKRITDINILKKLFPKSEFKILDSGQYLRSLDSGEFVTESVFGNPKLK